MRNFYVVAFLISNLTSSFAQDTLRVMTYNVLHYGDRCQGSNNFHHQQLKAIVKYEKPDVLGLVKVQTIMTSPTGFGISPVGFADSILNAAMNAAYPNKYEHCPVVNFSGDADDDMDLLYYDKNKLGYLSVVNLCGIQEDFNLYKLYYKDPHLSITKDTTFLYFILNHTVSGTYEVPRDQQDSIVVRSLRKKFAHLPNLISMGDFNVHSSYESGYQLLTASSDSSFLFSDPPFSPDHQISYPASWQDNSSLFANYLNTSTRQGTLPNACGTDGGAKNWYIHILLSPWIVKNSNYVKYVPNSYHTIGNDGKRMGISINDSTNFKNTSVSPDVLNALFQLSDKYPIMVKLAVTQNTSGTSPADPDLPPETVTAVEEGNGNIRVSNPIESSATFYFPEEMIGNSVRMQWYDLVGRLAMNDEFTITSTSVSQPFSFGSGVYILRVQTERGGSAFRIIRK
jgi:endonuclease/exonuclease/phosphatase family metal-dependent hydrolase